MSRNTNDAQYTATTTTRQAGSTDNNGEWRDEHGNKINGAAAIGAAAAGVAGKTTHVGGVAVVPGVETTRVEKVTKVTTVKEVPDTDRRDTAYTAGVAGGVGTTGQRESTYTSSASAGRVGSGGATGGRDINVERDYQSTATSANRNTGAGSRQQQHDYSPERRAGIVSGQQSSRANYNETHQDTETRNRRYGETGGVGSSRTQAGAQIDHGVYRGDTRGQWNERQENTHGWRAERLSEEQMLEGSGKPMMLDAVAGTRNTRLVQREVVPTPFGYRQIQETWHQYGNQMVAGQPVEHWLKYLLLLPLALLFPLFLASLIGIPLLGTLIPWSKLFPFLAGIGHLGKSHRRTRDVTHSRLHRGYEIKPSSLYEDTGAAHHEAFCVPIAWETLLKNQKWYDVVLVANDGTQVLAHKVVLAARSPVLESELDALIARGTKENSKDDLEVCSHARPCKLTLKNVDGKLLKNFVEFLYSGRVADRNRVEDLLALGQAFEVVDLQESAAEELMYTLDDGTVGEALIMGHDYNHCGLRKAAKAYIRDNWKSVHRNSHFKRAVARRPTLLADDYIYSDREERSCHLVRPSIL